MKGYLVGHIREITHVRVKNAISFEMAVEIQFNQSKAELDTFRQRVWHDRRSG